MEYWWYRESRILLKYKIMGRIVVVENCGQCPECGYNEDHELEKFGEHYCIITGKTVETDTMPDNCPLPTNIGRDYEAEIARLKRELFMYKNTYGKK
jgi:hypothetical protein